MNASLRDCLSGVRLTEAERDASQALADYHSARARFYFNIGRENPGLK